MERKSGHLEIKALKEREFEGYGSVFGNVDQGGDIVVKGAFKRSLAQHKNSGTTPVGLFWMHDPSKVAGKWLDIREDDDGLAVRGVLADTDLGNEIHTLLKMDAVRGLSIGFVTKDQDYNKAGDRLIKEVDLWEVSVVSLPMNPLAQIAHVKSRMSAAGEYVPTIREFERHLRDVGCPQKVAKQMIAKLFDGDDSTGTVKDQQRDVESEEQALKALKAFEERMMLSVLRVPKIT